MNKWVERLRAEKNKEQTKPQDPNLEFQTEEDIEAIRKIIEDRFNEATELLKKEYPAGALKWAYENRPDLDKAINEVDVAIDVAYKQADIKCFNEALTAYLDVNKEIFKAYKEVT